MQAKLVVWTTPLQTKYAMHLSRIPLFLLGALSFACCLPQVKAHTTLRDIELVTAGDNHACALTTRGGVKCWGNNGSGRLGDGTTTQRLTPVGVVGLDSGVSAIAAGSGHTCALTEGGGVKCWGSNANGQLGDGSTTSRITPVDVVGLGSGVAAIAAGGGYTCALINGGVKCWGFNALGQLGNGAFSDQLSPVDVIGLSIDVIVIVAGSGHACALTAVGGMKCWGRNDLGQLADGTFSSERRTPVDVVGLNNGVSAIAAGGNHTCALTAARGVKCWGHNVFGQVGDGHFTTNQFTPADVVGLSNGVSAITAGSAHTCSIVEGIGVKCWGLNQYGQVGDTSTDNRNTPVSVSELNSEVTAIASGLDFTCAVMAGGEVACWGTNSEGQLGDGSTVNRLNAVDTDGLGIGVNMLAAGGWHTCGLTSAGEVKCWGRNSNGQLGDGSTINRLIAVNVSMLGAGVTSIASGNSHTCAVTAGGGAKCWGDNFVGQLGDGGTTDRFAPVDVSDLSTGVNVIAAGGIHACALTTGGGVKCWGNNGNGRLGDGTTTQRLTPVDVVGLGSGVSAIAAGGGHTCALTEGGGVKCWGSNANGQLGDGSTTSRITPVDVVGLSSGVAAIAAGDAHTCALASGAVKCWGSNVRGVLGDGSSTRRTVPTDVSSLGSGVMSISAGKLHTCALTAGGGIKCWGSGLSGQIGDGSISPGRLFPIDVSGLASGGSAIAAGGDHTCAILASGRVKCWGSDAFGQVGDGGRNNGQPGNVLVNDRAQNVASFTPGADGSSRLAKSDASGRYVVFESIAGNLLGAGMDTNGTIDIFRLDRMAGAVERISVNTDGSQLHGGDAIEPSVSANGQLVVFVAPNAAVTKLWGEPKSAALKRVKGGGFGVFLRNILTGTTQPVGNQPARGNGSNPVIAPDGETVVFTGTNTDPSQGAIGQENVFRVRLMRMGNALLPEGTECVSCKSRSVMGAEVADADGPSRNAVVSGDGTWIAFETEAKNALAQSASPCAAIQSREVLLRNVQTGTTRRVSPGSTLAPMNCGIVGSTNPSIDWSGLNVAFESDAALMPGSTAGTDQVFLSNANGTLIRLSQTASGEAANGASNQPAISGDGQTVVFVSAGSNLDGNFADTNNKADIHALRRDRGGIERLSKSTLGAEANDSANNPALNYNATLMVFDSAATNLVPNDSNGAVNDVFQREIPANSDVVFGSSFE